MIRINLLPTDRDKGAGRRSGGASFDIARQAPLIGSVLLLATVLGIGWWWWMLGRAEERLAAEIDEAKRETQRLGTILEQVRQFEEQKAQLEQRVSLIEELRQGQAAPVHLLDELSRALPDMLWLTQLKQAGSELTIEGRCTTLTALSDFVANLERSSYFRRPVEILDSKVEQAPAPVGELTRFTLKATFAPPGVEPAAPEAPQRQARR
ncbi:MAG TPA: PilN domain-containing protein [Vicinamibacterales bacterium]